MIEVKQSDREAAEMVYDDLCRQFKVTRVQAMTPDDDELVQVFAAHRQQAEDAIIRAADKWLAAQYGLNPLVADIDRIRGIDAGGEG